MLSDKENMYLRYQSDFKELFRNNLLQLLSLSCKSLTFSQEKHLATTKMNDNGQLAANGN